MKSKLTRIIHVGIAHMKLNEVLSEKGFVKLPVPKKYLETKFDKTLELGVSVKAHHCQICWYKTKFKQHLEKHYYSHFGDELRSICKKVGRDLKCTICDYDAKTKTDMAYHVGIKHGYINKILRTKGFNIIRKKKQRIVQKENTKPVDELETITSEIKGSDILENILEILSEKTKPKPVESSQTSGKPGDSRCSICSEHFETKAMLFSHLSNYHGKNRFKCEQCDKTFGQSANLLTHKQLHLGIKPFNCQFCGMSFTQKCNMKTHQQRRHSLVLK